MATKEKALNEQQLNDSMTFKIEEQKQKYKGPTVSVFLPKLEDTGDQGIQVDQYEHVTIANEEKEEIFYVLRGEWVDVPINVYAILKSKYPKL